MKLRFHPHAVVRMQERDLSVEAVLQVIEKPDGSISQSKDKTIYYKRLSSRRDNLVAAVVVELLPGEILEVLTVLINFQVRK